MLTKAKEHLGQLFRKGRVWTQKAFQSFDHDFPSWATGVVIPHGIYDLALNLGHINIGLSHDTGEFACDSFRWFWKCIGQQRYPDATKILILCDAGGSNSASQDLFRNDERDATTVFLQNSPRWPDDLPTVDSGFTLRGMVGTQARSREFSRTKTASRLERSGGIRVGTAQFNFGVPPSNMVRRRVTTHERAIRWGAS